MLQAQLNCLTYRKLDREILGAEHYRRISQDDVLRGDRKIAFFGFEVQSKPPAENDQLIVHLIVAMARRENAVRMLKAVAGRIERFDRPGELEWFIEEFFDPFDKLGQVHLQDFL